MASGSSYSSKIVEFVASTKFGQFLIKKFADLLLILEQPAKYCVNGESDGEKRKLPWLVFWTVLLYLQLFRVVISMILVQFNRNPIEAKDVVKCLQTWRRSLRSIRFRGLRKNRESQSGKEKSNGNGVGASPRKQPGEKRNHDEMLVDDLLDELVNRTFTDTDDNDSTFMISKYDVDVSTSGSSHGQSQSEGYRSKNVTDSSLQDSLPIVSESEHNEPSMSSKSNESTFVSTVEDTESQFAMTEEDSVSSLNEEGASKSELELEFSNKQNGKASLNQPSDPVDAMMSKLVELEKNGKPFSKKNQLGNKKKRNHSLTSQENLNRHKTSKNSKSQECLNKL